MERREFQVVRTVRRVRADLERWSEEHGCGSLRQSQGSMSLQRCPDPAADQRQLHPSVAELATAGRAFEAGT
ncbi:MAG TPA: hypothetical protein VEL76_14190 [Gemmataceae bacterium]|nr:hypothetical protein [Gemmataceae bacterium]